MALIVQKFGGTSVANIERIRHVATLVEREVKKGNKVITVVSAMSGVTNQLVGLVNQVSDLTNNAALPEYDSVVATGEQVTSGLLALELQTKGYKARSFLGWQIPFTTDKSYSKARIETIEADKIHAAMDNYDAIIIPGFQGINRDENRVTTLGRGGSDTSAVAIAAAVKADRCDIYTDVDGIYTTDPRMVPAARKLNKIAYEEMLELASMGAKVLQTRSVEMAMRYQVPLQVLTSFEDKPGTTLVNEDEIMERRLITGIAASKDEARVTVTKVKNTPGVAAQIFTPLAEAKCNVDMIVQNVTEGGEYTDMTFTVPVADLPRAKVALEAANKAGDISYASLSADEGVAKLSLVGVGMKSNPGIAQQMFEVLADKGVNILVISTSEIKISVLIEADYLELASRSLHSAFGLDG